MLYVNKDQIRKRKCLCFFRIENWIYLNPNKKWVNADLIDMVKERNRYAKLEKKFHTVSMLGKNT